MSTIEQHINQRSKNDLKKAVFKTGTALAKSGNMKRRITHKEITLAFGILIALVIAFTLWANNPAEQSSAHFTILPHPTLPVAAKSMIDTVIGILF